MARSARNAEYTKEYNRKMFLRLLRREPLSRAEMARRLGLTRAASSLIADELLHEGIIRETIATSKQLGRTPVPLALCPDWAYAIGVYLNRDGCTAALVNICGEVLEKERLRIGEGEGEEKLSPLVDSINRMLANARLSMDALVGVGISAPGPLDGESGRILNPPRFDLWHQTDIGPMLSTELGVPVYLENNATCLARYNLGKPEVEGSENFLLLLVDSGIGSGVISEGKVLKGAGYFTGELGHISINYKGKRCACGNVGCLEAYASIPNLLSGNSFSDWSQVIARRESKEAAALIRKEVEYLSAGIVSLINLVSIDTVLLAGDLLKGAEYFAPILEETVNSRILRRDILPVRVMPSCPGPDAQVKSAADAAFDRYLMV